MFLGNIGAKSAAFINHKPFHPGTFENLERVWMAEEKHKKELQKQKELQERRKEEKKIHELRMALREKDINVASAFEEIEKKKSSSTAIAAKSQRAFQKKNLKTNKQGKKNLLDNAGESDSKMLSSQYKEDVYVGDHNSVYGSYFCTQSKKWGYKCCKSLERNKPCGAIREIDSNSPAKINSLSNNKKEQTGETISSFLQINMPTNAKQDERKKRKANDEAVFDSNHYETKQPKKKKKNGNGVAFGSVGLADVLCRLKDEECF